jgi:ParB family transcriptional regulator, chromosome partitioning protein
VSTQPRLGRGLAALMGDTAPERPSGTPGASNLGTVQSLSIDTLEPGPFQPRRSMAPGAMDELVESIKARGILQPILARRDPANPNRYQIIAGERRWRAAQSAGLHDVPVLLRELSDRDAMAASLVENLQRQDLNAIEEAEGYQRLLQEFGLTQEQLGAAVGKSRSHIANTIRLLQLPPAVRTEVQNGRLSAGHARALLAHANPEQAAHQVLADGLNVRQTEALTTNARPERARNTDSGKPRDPETEALERDLSEKLGLKVQIAFDGHGGSVRISYRSLDQLDGLIAILSR